MPMRSLAVFALLFALSASGVAQVRGGTAVIVVQADPGHLNPAISTGSHVHAVADSLYNALIELDRDLTATGPRAALDGQRARRRLYLPSRAECEVARRHAVHVGRRQVHI